MRLKILCRGWDGGAKSNAVMDRINISSQSVITKRTQGIEAVREGWREMDESRAGGEVNIPV